jgi:rare lipoprotein A
VTNLRNGRQTVVRINDRGPYSHGRVIDVSYAAAKDLGMLEAGVVPVRVEVLQP